MPKKRIPFLIEAIVIAAVVAFDLLLKAYAEDNLVGQNVPFIPGLLSLTYVQNWGAAFGILQGGRPFFIVVTIIAFFVFFFMLYKKKEGHFLFRFSLALIIGGTAGNFIDRVKLGYVRDMLNFEFIQFPVFNIADAALTVGAVLACVYYLFIYKEPEKEAVAASESAENSQPEGKSEVFHNEDGRPNGESAANIDGQPEGGREGAPLGESLNGKANNNS